MLKVHREGKLSKQVLRSGTSIGANICEATRAQSRKDFIAKMNIALKESYETEYWLRLLYKADYITEIEFKSIFTENQDISNIIAKILITSKSISEE
jgi:four helix bundle protein